MPPGAGSATAVPAQDFFPVARPVFLGATNHFFSAPPPIILGDQRRPFSKKRFVFEADEPTFLLLKNMIENPISTNFQDFQKVIIGLIYNATSKKLK